MNKYFIVQTFILIFIQISPSFSFFLFCSKFYKQGVTCPPDGETTKIYKNIADDACVASCTENYINVAGNQCVANCNGNYINTAGTQCVTNCSSDCINVAGDQCVTDCHESGYYYYVGGVKHCQTKCNSSNPYVTADTTSCQAISSTLRKCSGATPYFFAGTKGYCQANCNVSVNGGSQIFPYVLLDNGEYVCLREGCDININNGFEYQDSVTDAQNPRCLRRCPEYAYFLDATATPKQCLKSCPTTKPYVEVDYQDDKSFVCKASCKTNYYTDQITSNTIKYCVPSCKNLVPTAFIFNGTCVRSCPSSRPYLDYTTNVNNPECKLDCPTAAKYIDGLTNSSQKVCVNSCYNLDPPAYIHTDGKTCVRYCKNGDNSIPIDFISDPLNPKCVASCPTSSPKTYEYTEIIKIPVESYYRILSTENYSLKTCVLSCWNQSQPKFIDGNSCVDTCSNYIDQLSDPENPKCISDCPTQINDKNVYKDELTSSDFKYCVYSCQNLDPPAYIYSEKCYRSCPGGTYIKDVDAINPECVAVCSGDKKYIDPTGKFCVKSCKLLNPTAYLSADKNNCIQTCNDYVDQTSVSNTLNNITIYENYCVNQFSNCPSGYNYFNNVRNVKYCVNKCYNLNPPAYINGNECVQQCPSTGAIYLDLISDKENPKCVEFCPLGNYIDTFTNVSQIQCSKSCKNLIPVAYVDKTDATNPKCTRECPSNLNILIQSEDSDYEFICSQECPENYYLDTLTFWNILVCTTSCRHLIPEAYVNEDQKNCTRQCPISKPYLIPNSKNELVCSANCTDNYPYIDEITAPGLIFCVQSCNNLNPPAFINSYDANKIKCVRDCKEETFVPYVDILTDQYNPTCASKCPTNTHIDKTSNGQMYCVKSCKNLTPQAYKYTDPDIDNKTICLLQCPPNAAYVNTVDENNPKCVSTCPVHYFLDNELTTPGLKICIPSCHNLIPSAYIYLDTDNNNQNTCVSKCPNSVPYVNAVDEDMPKCVSSCPTHYFIDNELTTQGLKLCVPSCKNLIPSSFIYDDPGLQKEICVRKCPADAQFINPENVDKPRCSNKCPTDYFQDNELTATGIKTCVTSCIQLNPPAYIYTDPDDQQEKCVHQCPDDAQFVEMTDQDKPRCVSVCPEDYFLDDEITIKGIKMCVPSCNNQNPPAFIYTDPDDNFEKCTQKCPSFAPYLEKTNPENPRCLAACPADYYLDEITTPGLKICVQSCKNLNPSSFIYTDPDLKMKKCVRKCPQFQAEKYVDKTTDPDFPTCVSTCPADHFINTITYYDDEKIQTYIIKICVSSCKNLDPPALIYKDDKINNKEICITKCPYNLTHKYYIDKSDPDFPRCSTQCPTNYYIDELTTEGIKMCVPSCRNLEPMSYVYTDTEIQKEKCIRQCPHNAKYIDMTTDPEHPRCTTTCPIGHYIDDEETIKGIKMCVLSCKNLNPMAYLFNDTNDQNTLKCVQKCPESVKYVDITTDPDNPKCISVCPNDYYIDDITSDAKICVSSCYNIQPNLFIYQDSSLNNLKRCVRDCSVLSQATYVNSVDPSNPFCTEQCPTNYYIDSLTVKGQNICVSSCKEIEPSAYIDPSNSTHQKCVRECPQELPIIDAITNPDHPVCTNSCGSNHIYTYRIKLGEEVEKNVQECVKSCIEFDQYIYIDKDDNDKTKCKSTCPNNFYVDYLSTEFYFNNPSCVSLCPEGYYIDSLTNTNKIFCVPSCKKLTPTAYIDTNLVGQLQCQRTCNIKYKYIDETTNVDNPKCVSSCPSESKYIFDTEKLGLKFCVESCRLNITKPYIDEITTPNKPDCVASCRKTAPYLDEVSNPAYPKCLQNCPSTAKYLDLINNSEIPVCLNICKDKAPYYDAVTIPETPKCVTQCPTKTYIENYHCLVCQSPCLECSNNATACTKCIDQYYFFQNSCYKICPDGYYGDSSDWTCKDCYFACQTCSGKLETECKSCIDDYILTKNKECISEKKFISDVSNLEVNDINSFDELEVPIQQIKNIGNIQNSSNTSNTIQNYMIQTVEKSVTYLDQYVKSQIDLNNTDKQAKLAENLKEVIFIYLILKKQITNITIQLPVDKLSTVISEFVTKLNATVSNETIVNNLCQTTNNMIKYMKSGSKNFNNTQASYSISENNLFDEIAKIGDIGFKILTKNDWQTRRILQSIFQYFIQYEEFSMVLQSHLFEEEKWISEIQSQSQTDNFFYYEQNEKINYEDLIKVAVNYPKSFVEEIKNKVRDEYIEAILIKIISYNYLREAHNKYQQAILDTQNIFGSVVTFQFQYQHPKTIKLNHLDMNEVSAYISVKVPLNYKLSGNENLQCMTYDEDNEKWDDKNIVTVEKTDTYVICRTRQTNAITVIDTQGIDLKKNYALYFAFFQIPFAALVLFLVYQLKDNDSQGKKYLSFSPLLSSLTALNGAHLIAKIMLFSFQLALIEFFVALFYNFNHWLNEGEIKHAVLVIVYSLLINYVGKYFFGVILNSIYSKSHSQDFIIAIKYFRCALFALFISACYLGLSFGTCYFVYNPEQFQQFLLFNKSDKFYNIGLYTTLIAFGFDFIAFDLFFVLLLIILKLPDEKLKIFSYGGYLSINSQILIAKRIEKYCISEENQINQNK